ncbi:crt [Symbiodinium natans]|uniref:Crt protein n=1 Tax=Symbiodinium natans TaxID=878477 RepID=A0A812TYT7_9DINO|nr:crt [Symbiodinium natans]
MGAVASSPAPPASESKPSSAFTGLTRLGRSEETTQAESDPEEFSCVMGDVEGSSLRPRARLSKVASWEQLPQSHRGIRLSELWDFYRPCQEWLEDLRWRCVMDPAAVATLPAWDPKLVACAEHRHLPAVSKAETSMRKEMIIPACSELQVSYVELLRQRAAGMCGSFDGVKADTFVSHWWGEEFPKFMRTLDNFSRARTARLPWARCTTSYRDPGSWAFWICAFANNQYAIDHALGDSTGHTSPRTAVLSSAFATALMSVSDAVAILDDHARIYSRIWCCFELFSVARLLPQRQGIRLEIFIANETGVVSSGCGNVSSMNMLIQSVKTSEAQASNPADKAMIQSAMEAEGTSNDDLDNALQCLAREGQRAARHRACIESCFIFVIAQIVLINLVISMYAIVYNYDPGTEHQILDLMHDGIETVKQVSRHFTIAMLAGTTILFAYKACYWHSSEGYSRRVRVNVNLVLLNLCIGVVIVTVVFPLTLNQWTMLLLCLSGSIYVILAMFPSISPLGIVFQFFVYINPKRYSKDSFYRGSKGSIALSLMVSYGPITFGETAAAS